MTPEMGPGIRRPNFPHQKWRLHRIKMTDTSLFLKKFMTRDKNIAMTLDKVWFKTELTLGSLILNLQNIPENSPFPIIYYKSMIRPSSFLDSSTIEKHSL